MKTIPDDIIRIRDENTPTIIWEASEGRVKNILIF